MTVESDILAALTDLVNGRVFPDIAQAGAAPPYITYQQIGGQAPTFLERSLPSKKNGRFQVNVWAQTRKEAAALAPQVELALVQAKAFQASPIGAYSSVYENDTKLYGTRQDFSIWSDR